MPKKYYLIVCEAEATEPIYFKSLRDSLPEHIVAVEISGEGRNTIGVVKAAMEKRQSRQADRLLPPFDEVFAVFDKDDFPDENFNRAIALAQSENIVPAYSNEAFELWYVLHFQYLDTGISRKQYQVVLKERLGDYRKNSTEMYALLQEKGNEAQAIKWAERLLSEKQFGNPAKENPTTRVHEIVRTLSAFK